MSRDTKLTAATLLRRTFCGLKEAFPAQEIVLPEAVRVHMTSFDDDDRLRDHCLSYRRVLVVSTGQRPQVICLGHNGHERLTSSFNADLMALGHFNTDPKDDLVGQVIDRLSTCACFSHSLLCARGDGVLVVPDDSAHLSKIWPTVRKVVSEHIVGLGLHRFVDIPEQNCQESGRSVMLYHPTLVPCLTQALHQVLQTPPEI